MKFKTRFFAYPYLIWMVVFTLAPIALIAYYAFTDKSGAFTLANLANALDPAYMGVLWRSVALAFSCTVICLLLAYPAAYILSRRKNGGVLSVLFMLPMWMNFLLRTYSWMTLLENTGLVNTLLQAMGLSTVTFLYNANAVLLGMVYNYLPFMILPILTALQKIDHSYVEAAQDLGASPARVFLKVILPMSVPGIISGVTMVFMPAVTTFVISRLLGGSHFMLFGDLIEQQFLTSGNWNLGSMMSLFMMVIMLISMAIMNRFGSDTEGRGLI